MNYSGYSNFDVLNGDGIRVVLWVTGCFHNCNGCFSPQTHNPKCGTVFDKDVEGILFEDLQQPFIKGITFSGGDPLHKRNFDTILNLSKKVKSSLVGKDVWLYTGYTLEQIQNDEKRVDILKHIDYLVDGKYDKTLPSAKFRGSSNQRIIHLVGGEVVNIE